MVSNTQKTKKIRVRRNKRMGKRRKNLVQRQGTPVFPVHPEGYDPNAADAKPATANSKA